MEVSTIRTSYVDEVRRDVILKYEINLFQDRQAEAPKEKIVYGPEPGASAGGEETEEDEALGISGVRIVKPGSRVSISFGILIT